MNTLQTGKLDLWRFQVLVITLISCFLMAATKPTCAQEIHDSLSGRLKNSGKIKLPAMQDSLSYELQKKRIASSSEFYKKVKSSAQSNFFYRNLYPILFRKPPATKSSEIISGSDSLPYLTQKDKVIRSVRIYKAPVFGSSIFDTSVISANWTDRLLNSIHFNTNDAVIRSYLNIRYPAGKP